MRVISFSRGKGDVLSSPNLPERWRKARRKERNGCIWVCCWLFFKQVICFEAHVCAHACLWLQLWWSVPNYYAWSWLFALTVDVCNNYCVIFCYFYFFANAMKCAFVWCSGVLWTQTYDVNRFQLSGLTLL